MFNMRAVREVSAMVIPAHRLHASLASFKIRRQGEVDEPVPENFIRGGRVQRTCLTIHTTTDVSRDGEVRELAEGGREVYMYNRLPYAHEVDKYVVFYDTRQSARDAMEVVVFRRALNRAGIIFVPIRPKEDKFGLDAVMWYVRIKGDHKHSAEAQ